MLLFFPPRSLEHTGKSNNRYELHRTVIVSLPTGSYSSGKIYMAKEFHVQDKPFPNLIWATFSFQLGAAFLPAICVPLSETWGRQPGYFVGYSILIISLFPSAFAHNFATLIVTRFFGGGAAASTINIVGGSISDVWRGSMARSHPMSVYIFSTTVGISLGPFIGGGLQRIHIGEPWRRYVCYSNLNRPVDTSTMDLCHRSESLVIKVTN